MMPSDPARAFVRAVALDIGSTRAEKIHAAALVHQFMAAGFSIRIVETLGDRHHPVAYALATDQRRAIARHCAAALAFYPALLESMISHLHMLADSPLEHDAAEAVTSAGLKHFAEANL
jgi:hypothetical protein